MKPKNKKILALLCFPVLIAVMVLPLCSWVNTSNSYAVNYVSYPMTNFSFGFQRTGNVEYYGTVFNPQYITVFPYSSDGSITTTGGNLGPFSFTVDDYTSDLNDYVFDKSVVLYMRNDQYATLTGNVHIDFFNGYSPVEFFGFNGSGGSLHELYYLASSIMISYSTAVVNDDSSVTWSYQQYNTYSSVNLSEYFEEGEGYLYPRDFCLEILLNQGIIDKFNQPYFRLHSVDFVFNHVYSAGFEGITFCSNLMEQGKAQMVFNQFFDTELYYANSSGYSFGFAEGKTFGYNLGYREGERVSYDKGYNVGVDEGYRDGYATGHADGVTETYQPAYNSGYNSGYSEGKLDGIESAGTDYSTGYAAGYADGKNKVLSDDPKVWQSLSTFLESTVGAFLDAELFPNFRISTLLSIFVGGVLLIAFLKIFAGG